MRETCLGKMTILKFAVFVATAITTISCDQKEPPSATQPSTSDNADAVTHQDIDWDMINALPRLPDSSGEGHVIVNGYALPRNVKGDPIVKDEWTAGFTQEYPLYIDCGTQMLELWQGDKDAPAIAGATQLPPDETVFIEVPEDEELPVLTAQAASVGPGVDITSLSGAQQTSHDGYALIWNWGESLPDSAPPIAIPSSPPYPNVAFFSPAPPAPWKPVVMSDKQMFAICVKSYSDIELNGSIIEGTAVAAFPVSTANIAAIMAAPPSADLVWIVVNYVQDGVLNDVRADGSVGVSIAPGDLPFTLSSNQVKFTPSVDFVGLQNFTFLINDGVADSPTYTAVINVTVVNNPPLGQDIEVEVEENTEDNTITLPGTDADGA